MYASAYTHKCIKLYNYINDIGGDEMSAVKNAVVKRFKNICNKRGIATNELATISGVTPSTVYSLFDEKRHNVSITTIKILCDGLEITLSEFFTSEEFEYLEQELK